MSLRSRLFLLGWRTASRAPEWLVRGVMHVAAEVAWLLHGSGVRQLEANLARAVPTADARQLRRLSREGMRRYLRYYGETFMLGRMTP
ncbi:MAG TPA: phosphatidylinositol mannoside acyltransferase, partial [Actinotalea sp.]|nr:phosphatidylinositol mannoside acyltransferase [Actinotalea sp.]